MVISLHTTALTVLTITDVVLGVITLAQRVLRTNKYELRET